MIDFSTEQLVEQVALLKATNGEMFTAHDVTRVIRSQLGRGVNIVHAEVRDLVHGLYEAGKLGSDYSRTLANFPGVSPLPWIYHRTTDDSTRYRRPSDDAPPNPFQGISVAPAVATPPLDEESVCHVDARETLCIPAKFIRAIGLQAGCPAYIYSDFLNNCVRLIGILPAGDYAEYVVDRNENVRITQYALQKCGLGGEEYLIEQAGNAVKITRQS